MYQLKLGRIRILVLIHHDITETLLIIIQNIRAGLKQLHCLYDQIVKIQRIILMQNLLIFLINLRRPLLRVIPHGLQLIFHRGDQAVLCR